jgi:hypothetical protein
VPAFLAFVSIDRHPPAREGKAPHLGNRKYGNYMKVHGTCTVTNSAADSIIPNPGQIRVRTACQLELTSSVR